MSCDRYDRLINLYVDGRLDQSQKRELEEHISQCERCQNKFNSLRLVEQKAKGLEIKHPPEEYWATFSSRIKEKIVSQQKKSVVFSPKKLLDNIFTFTPLKVKVAAGVISVVLVFLVGKLFVNSRGEQTLPSRETTETKEQPKLDMVEIESETKLLPAERTKKEEKKPEKPGMAREKIAERSEEIVPAIKGEKDAVAQITKEEPSLFEVPKGQQIPPSVSSAIQIPEPVETEGEEMAVVPESKSTGAGVDQKGETRKAHQQETAKISTPIAGDTLYTKETREILTPAIQPDFEGAQIPLQTITYELKDVTIPRIKETDTSVQTDTLKRVIQVWKEFIQENPSDSLSPEGYMQVSNAYYLLAKVSQDTSFISEGSKFIEQSITQVHDPTLKEELNRKLMQIKALR